MDRYEVIDEELRRLHIQLATIPSGELVRRSPILERIDKLHKFLTEKQQPRESGGGK